MGGSDGRGVPVVPGHGSAVQGVPVAVERGVARDNDAHPAEVAAPFAILAGALLMMAAGVPWYAAIMAVGSWSLVIVLYFAVRDW